MDQDLFHNMFYQSGQESLAKLKEEPSNADYKNPDKDVDNEAKLINKTMEDKRRHKLDSQ